MAPLRSAAHHEGTDINLLVDDVRWTGEGWSRRASLMTARRMKWVEAGADHRWSKRASLQCGKLVNGDKENRASRRPGLS